MGFVEGRIEGEKVFHGKVFPKTYLPPSSSCGVSAGVLAVMVRDERGRLVDEVKRHGAVLFRGFGVRTAEEFSGVVAAFGWEDFRYSGATERTKLADRVYTVNAVPLDVMISFHHEMALIKEFPSKIFFFCQQPPPHGGETSIIPSYLIVEKMKEKVPHVIEKLEKDGIIFVLHTKSAYNSNKTNNKEENPTSSVNLLWQTMLNTNDQGEAYKRAIEMFGRCNVNFNSDGTADFICGPMNPIKEFDGEKVMFNRIVGYETRERDAHICFGDGSPITPEASEAFNSIIEKNCVDICWEKGDVLLLDNHTVQHARRPAQPPRVILVSLSK